MQERHLYEYAVIRIVPRIEREEFINVGVILYCPKQKFLGTRISFNAQRLQALCPLTDTALVKIHLDAFEQIANGTAIHSPLAGSHTQHHYSNFQSTQRIMFAGAGHFGAAA
jgi:hypothetical protein